MFVYNKEARGQNSRMELVERVSTALERKRMTWADLARAMGVSEQRVNNWRKRGIPASQVRAIEAALGLSRYALDYDKADDGDDDGVIAEFAWVYRHATADGKALLINTIAAVRKAFVADERSARRTKKQQ